MLPLNYFLFLQIILFMFITPGTPRIVIISYSMNYGVQKCIWTALGDVTANTIQAILVIFFLGSFFVDNPNFLNTFKWIGIAYLLYLAYDIYNSRPKEINSNNNSSKSIFSFFKDGFLVAGLSPKFDSKIAFSIALTMDLSHTVIDKVRASSTETFAAWVSGVAVP